MAAVEGLNFLDFGPDTQGSQYDANDFTLPSQSQFTQTQVCTAAGTHHIDVLDAGNDMPHCD
jgi:hypothetical protein